MITLVKLKISFVLLSSTSLLLIAFYFQYFESLYPCKLCVLQRVPHVLSVIVSTIYLLRPNNGVKPIFLLGCFMLSGTFLSGYHSGIELNFWNGFSSCTGIKNIQTLSPENLLEKILETPVTKCDEILWSLFGMSMATWNFFISIILLVVVILAFKNQRNFESINSESQ